MVTEKDVAIMKAMACVARATYTIQGFRGKQHGPTQALEQAVANLNVAAKALYSALGKEEQA
jgi:hypothetical protein